MLSVVRLPVGVGVPLPPCAVILWLSLTGRPVQQPEISVDQATWFPFNENTRYRLGFKRRVWMRQQLSGTIVVHVVTDADCDDAHLSQASAVNVNTNVTPFTSSGVVVEITSQSPASNINGIVIYKDTTIAMPRAGLDTNFAQLCVGPVSGTIRLACAMPGSPLRLPRDIMCPQGYGIFIRYVGSIYYQIKYRR